MVILGVGRNFSCLALLNLLLQGSEVGRDGKDLIFSASREHCCLPLLLAIANEISYNIDIPENKQLSKT